MRGTVAVVPTSGLSAGLPQVADTCLVFCYTTARHSCGCLAAWSAVRNLWSAVRAKPYSRANKARIRSRICTDNVFYVLHGVQ